MGVPKGVERNSEPRAYDESELGWLALSRGTLDRVSTLRRDDEWQGRAWTDPSSRVLIVEKGKALVREDVAELVLFPPEHAPEGERYLLGVEDDVAYFAVSGPLPDVEKAAPAALHEVGALLGDRESGLLTHAVALQNWHSSHLHCARCGGSTTLASAGHSRVCTDDGTEEFPRVDPAVITLVHDSRERILLARGADWPPKWMSALAGFAEPGESLEQTVAREVFEEVGLVVTGLRYVGSQPWPLPRSLMMGFFARIEEDQDPRVDAEEIGEARWFTREELVEAANAEEILLPGKVSIARRLIEKWYGGELPGPWGLV